MRQQLFPILFLVCSSIVLVQGVRLFDIFANGHNRGRQHHRYPEHYCTDLSTPCDYAIREQSGELHRTPRPSCTCRDRACPNDWDDDSGRSVTKDIVMVDNTRMAVQLRYCDEVSASRMCSGDEVTMTMSGYGPVPLYVEKTYCFCEEGVSAQLQMSWLGERHKTFYNYTCNRPTCEVTSGDNTAAPTCRQQIIDYSDNTFQRLSLYLCDCPRSRQCLLQTEGFATNALWKCVVV